MKKALSFLICTLSLNLFAISENNFDATYATFVTSFYQQGVEGSFIGAKGLRINYYVNKVDNERGAIVILTGKSESYIKYAELMYDLSELGYSFYIMDHRGMGFSERVDKEEPSKVYVRKFKYYVQDVKSFVDKVVLQDNHDELVLLSHSMGGAVALWFLEDYPGIFDKAVFSAPMLTVDTGKYPATVASFLANILSVFGQGNQFAPGQGPWALPEFETSRTTTSFVRWNKWELDIILSNPEVKSLGVANRWIGQSLNTTGGIVRRADRVEIPLLMFQAGQDFYAKPKGQDKACLKKAQNCRLVYLQNSKHEILMEHDEIRDVALEEITIFLNN